MTSRNYVLNWNVTLSVYNVTIRLIWNPGLNQTLENFRHMLTVWTGVLVSLHSELFNSPELIVNAFSAYFTNNYSNCAVTTIEDYFDTTPNASPNDCRIFLNLKML